MNVKILGVGCKKCQMLEEKVRALVAKHNLNAQIEKITDVQEIMKYRIMMVPGLVIDEEVKSVGIIPKEQQLLEWLKGQ